MATSSQYAGRVVGNCDAEEENLYAYGKGGIRRDVPNGLQIREDAGVGAGYTFYWDEKNSQVSIEGGPHWLHENNVGVATSNAAAARVAGNLESALTDNLTLIGWTEFLQSLDDSDDQVWTGQLSLRWSLDESWFIQGTAAVAWDGTPGPGLSSTDTRYTLGIGSTF